MLGLTVTDYGGDAGQPSDRLRRMLEAAATQENVGIDYDRRAGERFDLSMWGARAGPHADAVRLT